MKVHGYKGKQSCYKLVYMLIEEENYFDTFIDDFCKRCQVYPMKIKEDVFVTSKTFKVQTKLESGIKIKYLRTYNGEKYCNKDFDVLCKIEALKNN